MWLLRADNRAASPAVFEAFRKFVHTAPHLEVLRCEATFRHAQSNTFLDGGDGRLAVKLKVLDCSRTLRGVRVCSVAHRRRLSRPACVWSAALGAVVTVAAMVRCRQLMGFATAGGDFAGSYAGALLHEAVCQSASAERGGYGAACARAASAFVCC